MTPHFNADRFLVMDVNRPGAMALLRDLLVCERLKFLWNARSQPGADALALPTKTVGASGRVRVVELLLREFHKGNE